MVYSRYIVNPKTPKPTKILESGLSQEKKAFWSFSFGSLNSWCFKRACEQGTPQRHTKILGLKCWPVFGISYLHSGYILTRIELYVVDFIQIKHRTSGCECRSDCNLFPKPGTLKDPFLFRGLYSRGQKVGTWPSSDLKPKKKEN